MVEYDEPIKGIEVSYPEWMFLEGYGAFKNHLMDYIETWMKPDDIWRSYKTTKKDARFKYDPAP